MNHAPNVEDLQTNLDHVLEEMRQSLEDMITLGKKFKLKSNQAKEIGKALARLKKNTPTLKPRQRVDELAPGHCLTTVKGSLYHSIIAAMARLGALRTHHQVIKNYANMIRSDNKDRLAKDLINTLKVSEAHLEAFVRADPDFRAWADKNTARLQAKAAAGNAQARKDLANPNICKDGHWIGDFEEAYGVLKQGWTKKNTYTRRNCRILRNAKCLFDVIREGAERSFVLYPEEYEAVFLEAKDLAGFTA